MAAERTQVTTISVLSNQEAPVYQDNWVVVFGFLTDGHAVSSVLQEFQSCGNIDNWRYPPASNCNWIFIRFETNLGAQRALKKNGQRMGTVPMMIGVQPPLPEDRRFLQQHADGVWQSKGMGIAVPERKFVLATTTGKVSMRMLSCRKSRFACTLHHPIARVQSSDVTFFVLMPFLQQRYLCRMLQCRSCYQGPGRRS